MKRKHSCSCIIQEAHVKINYLQNLANSGYYFLPLLSQFLILNWEYDDQCVSVVCFLNIMSVICLIWSVSWVDKHHLIRIHDIMCPKNCNVCFSIIAVHLCFIFRSRSIDALLRSSVSEVSSIWS